MPAEELKRTWARGECKGSPSKLLEGQAQALENVIHVEGN